MSGKNIEEKGRPTDAIGGNLGKWHSNMCILSQEDVDGHIQCASTDAPTNREGAYEESWDDGPDVCLRCKCLIGVLKRHCANSARRDEDDSRTT